MQEGESKMAEDLMERLRRYEEELISQKDKVWDDELESLELFMKKPSEDNAKKYHFLSGSRAGYTYAMISFYDHFPELKSEHRATER